MSFSYRLILLLALLLTGLPLFAQGLTEQARSVRSMVSGIVSYTRWPALSGPPKLCIFSSSHFTSALQDTSSGTLPYLPVIVHTDQDILVAECNGFFFGNESPTYQVELKNKYSTKALLLIAEQNTECVIGSAFCLIINDEEVRFSVNMDSLSRSGVRVSPDVLMLARKNKHG